MWPSLISETKFLDREIIYQDIWKVAFWIKLKYFPTSRQWRPSGVFIVNFERI